MKIPLAEKRHRSKGGKLPLSREAPPGQPVPPPEHTARRAGQTAGTSTAQLTAEDDLPTCGCQHHERPFPGTAEQSQTSPSDVLACRHSEQSGEDERERLGAAHKHATLSHPHLAHREALHHRFLPLPAVVSPPSHPHLRTGACTQPASLHSLLSRAVLSPQVIPSRQTPASSLA